VEGKVDVEIIGAGVTGCAAALRLATAGLRVRVRDAREVASGASGRNGGFVLRGGAMRYDHAREAYGVEAARELWRWTETGIDRLAELAGAAFRRTGSLRIAVDPDERAAIRAEYDALRVDGFDAEWLDAAPFGRFDGAVRNPADGTYDPVRSTRRIARAAAEAGVELREHSRVGSLDELGVEHVLVATDGYGRGLLPELDRWIRPLRSQVLITEPLPEQLYPLPHYGRQGHAYWQQLEDGRLLLGGFRDVDPAAEATDEEATSPTIHGALDAFLVELLGWSPQVERRWAGIFGATDDLLPLVGRVPGRDRVWVAAGYSGHGNVLGLMCGEAVADAILGRPDAVLPLLDPVRFVR
jgi:glycine/D-amino acid oxidase-like deaminating enzyme